MSPKPSFRYGAAEPNLAAMFSAPLMQEQPHNMEAEQALLGAILMNNDAMEHVADFLQPEHFYEPLHGQIFETCLRQISAGRRVTPVTLNPFFVNQPPVGELTIPQYLGRLISHATSVLNAKDYGQTIHDAAIRRELIALSESLMASAYSASMDQSPSELIQTAEKRLYSLGQHGAVGTEVSAGAAMSKALTLAEDAHANGTGLCGLSTGIASLDELLGGMSPGNVIVLAGRPAMGKAQPLNAKVLMRDGSWKAMGDIALGDSLASTDGAPSLVQGVFNRGHRQVYRLTFSDGRACEACGDHLWEIKYREWDDPRIVSTDAIITMLTKKRYQNRLVVRLVSGHFGNDGSRFPVDPWVLGVLLGDGGLSGGGVRFATPSEYVTSGLMAVAGGDVSVRWDGLHGAIVGNRRGKNSTLDGLRELGLCGLRSHEKFVPDIYKRGSRATRLAVIKGLLDTDGWVEKHGTLRYSSSSETLTKDVADIARSLGYWAKITTRPSHYIRNGKRTECRDAFSVCISGQAKAELIGRPERLSRLMEHSNWSRTLTIESIEPTRVTETCCIAVSHPTHLYVTNDYIVTHNSALAGNIAVNVAVAASELIYGANGSATPKGCPVGFFSQEMSDNELGARIISAQSEVPGSQIRRGSFDENQYLTMKRVVEAGHNLPLYFDTCGGITPQQVIAKARRWVRTRKIGLLIIDYLQLMTAPGAMGEYAKVTEAMATFKPLAKELNIPIIVLSQLSRKCEEREDKRPTMADLKSSGSIEQDADIVLFVYRDEYYVSKKEPPITKASEHQKWCDELSACAGMAEVILGKGRHTGDGKITVRFNGALTLFQD